MDHPWGISGPGFLWLYGVALVAAVGLAVYLRRRQRNPRLAEPVPVGDVNVVAYLVDGPRRVVETSLARLVEQGAVRVTRRGMVTRTVKTVPDPLDQAVLDQLGGRTRPVYELLDRATYIPQVAELARVCAAQRLKYGITEDDRTRRLGLLAPYVLLVVGVVRFVNGVVGQYPVLYLAFELAVTGIVIGVLHAWGRREYKFYTVHGERVIAAAEDAGETAARVALRGLSGYPDRDIASALRLTEYAPRPSSSRAVRAGAAGAVAGGSGCSGAAANCGSSSGSSGGGSSCGGGGCGGGGG